MQAVYDFPVSLQPVFIQSGFGGHDRRAVPKIRAVVRRDTEEPLCAVSDKYHLVPHKDVMDAAEGFVSYLGEPQRNFSLACNGAVVIGEYTYMDKTVAVTRGDLVGLRVYIENSYNKERAVRVIIGGIVLSCLNGMTVPKNVFHFSYKHSGEIKIQFPEPEEVIEVFRNQAGVWQQYAQRELTEERYRNLFNEAIEQGIIQKGALNELPSELTIWSLYNQFTFHITHESKASKLGQLNRMNRVSKWFEGFAV